MVDSPSDLRRYLIYVAERLRDGSRAASAHGLSIHHTRCVAERRSISQAHNMKQIDSSESRPVQRISFGLTGSRCERFHESINQHYVQAKAQ